MKEVTVAVSWPKAPYKGLNFYDASDWPLLAERESDVQAFVELLGESTTKVILMHGRSGAGKSSFIRAGVLPFVANVIPPFVWLKNRGAAPEPCIIRSTDDPMSRLAGALRMALEDRTQFDGLPISERQVIRDSLQLPASSVQEIASRLHNTLAKVTARIKGTLVLIIDQAEEVMTLAGGDVKTDKQLAFFNFIQDMCLQPLDLKIVLCLRSEYYGQFTDWFSITPTTTLSTVNYGLVPYMLHGLRDRKSLVDAMLRPTLKSNIARFGVRLDPPPYDIYGFEYEQDVAAKITDDVLLHCGESSALPVLQIVCNDLFNQVVVHEGRKVITSSDYSKWGGVKGAVDRFIDNSIIAVIKRCEQVPDRGLLDQWKDVVAHLVARQEDFSLTTTLLPEDEVIEYANRAGIRQSVSECLVEMASEDIRLLRRVTLISGKIDEQLTYFSLGHDSLAPSLFHWKEERAHILEQQRRSRRLKLLLTAASAVIFGGVLVGVYRHYAGKFEAIKTLQLVLRQDSSTDAGRRLFLTNFAIANTSSPADHVFQRIFFPDIDLDEVLRLYLKRAPVYIHRARAAGLDASRTAIVMLEPNETVTVHYFDTNSDARVLDQSTIQAGHSPVPSAGTSNSAAGVNSYFDAAGFVAYPVSKLLRAIPAVAHAGRVITLEPTGAKPRSLSEFVTAGQSGVGINFEAGLMRINVMEPHRLHFLDFAYGPAVGYTLLDNPPVNSGYPAQLLPTYSEFSEEYAVVQQTAEAKAGLPPSKGFRRWEVAVGSRLFDGDPISVAKLNISDTDAAKGDSAAQFGPPSYAGALSFSNRNEAIVVRETEDKFRVIPLDASAPPSLNLSVPDELKRFPPVRQPWRLTRPLLAAVHVARSDQGKPVWRLAWLHPGGVAAAEAVDDAGTLYPLQEKLFASIPRMEFAMKLTFDDTGQRLFLIAQLEPGVVDVRAWDLSNRRNIDLDRAPSQQLVTEACKIVSQVEAAEQTNLRTEAAAWTAIGSLEPCRGDF